MRAPHTLLLSIGLLFLEMPICSIQASAVLLTSPRSNVGEDDHEKGLVPGSFLIKTSGTGSVFGHWSSEGPMPDSDVDTRRYGGLDRGCPGRGSTCASFLVRCGGGAMTDGRGGGNVLGCCAAVDCMVLSFPSMSANCSSNYSRYCRRCSLVAFPEATAFINACKS